LWHVVGEHHQEYWSKRVVLGVQLVDEASHVRLVHVVRAPAPNTSTDSDLRGGSCWFGAHPDPLVLSQSVGDGGVHPNRPRLGPGLKPPDPTVNRGRRGQNLAKTELKPAVHNPVVRSHRRDQKVILRFRDEGHVEDGKIGPCQFAR